ncbi:hypothetical protein [Phormidesmis priestleyi]
MQSTDRQFLDHILDDRHQRSHKIEKCRMTNSDSRIENSSLCNVY